MRHVAPALTGLPRQYEEPIGVVERQPTEERGIDDAETDGVDANPERQGNHSGRREPSILDDQSECEAQILQHEA